MSGRAPPEDQIVDQNFRSAQPCIDRAGILHQRSFKIPLGFLQRLSKIPAGGTQPAAELNLAEHHEVLCIRIGRGLLLDAAGDILVELEAKGPGEAVCDLLLCLG